MKWPRNRALLGIAFEGNQMSVCEVRRAGDQLEILRSMKASLTLDLLTSDPELLGREIRNHLDHARIQEKRCVVCVPLKWLLRLHLELPNALSEEDIKSFIAIQAERGLPSAPENLSLSVSRFETAEAGRWATVAALPIHHLTALRKALSAARLHPVSITLGLSSQLPAKEETCAVLLSAHEDGIDMGIVAYGGIAALRFLPHRSESDQKESIFDVDMVVRELRVTLGGLPQVIQDNVRSVWVSGTPELKEAFFSQAKEPLARMGMSVNKLTAEGRAHSRVEGMLNQLSPYTYTAASRRLLGQPSDFEFLPPKLDRFKQLAGRISARAAFWLTCSALTLIVIIGTAFLWQYYRWSRLEKQWKRIEPTVTRVEQLQGKWRHYRPWFDDSIPSLTVLKKLTTAFPEDGFVWLRSLEIKGMSNIVCSGEATSNKELLNMLERLREIPGIEEPQVSYVRGNAPLQFTFSLRWNGEYHGI